MNYNVIHGSSYADHRVYCTALLYSIRNPPSVGDRRVEPNEPNSPPAFKPIDHFKMEWKRQPIWKYKIRIEVFMSKRKRGRALPRPLTKSPTPSSFGTRLWTPVSSEYTAAYSDGKERRSLLLGESSLFLPRVLRRNYQKIWNKIAGQEKNATKINLSNFSLIPPRRDEPHLLSQNKSSCYKYK